MEKVINRKGNRSFNCNIEKGTYGNCMYCHKQLRKIGKQSNNGKEFNANNGNDWKNRRFHKSCYKIFKEEETRDLIDIIKSNKYHIFD